MDIIVLAKHVVDVGEIKIDQNTNKPILQGLPTKISDIDKNALEEAIKIKEAKGGKVTVLTVGSPGAKEGIKELLAMGADEAVLVDSGGVSDYHALSQAIAAAVKKMGNYDLILCGEASIDMFAGEMGPRVAALLNIPQITYARSLKVEDDKVRAERDMGDRLVIMESPFPVLVSVTKEINEPRLPSLMQILGAANKPIHEWNFGDLGVEVEAGLEQVDIRGVSMVRKNIIFQEDSVDEAVNKMVESLAKEGLLG